MPLLVLALVIFGGIPVYLYGHQVLSDCRPVADGQVCKTWLRDAQFYWWTALVLAYVVIAGGYLRVARARGLGGRVLPYVLTGVGLVALSAAVSAVLIRFDLLAAYPDEPSTFVLVLLRLLDPTGAIGLALLVLAWLERHVALLLFTLLYLAVVLVPVDFGWEMRSQWQFAPPLAIGGGLLLLGSAGFALAQRLRRPR